MNDKEQKKRKPSVKPKMPFPVPPSRRNRHPDPLPVIARPEPLSLEIIIRSAPGQASYFVASSSGDYKLTFKETIYLNTNGDKALAEAATAALMSLTLGRTYWLRTAMRSERPSLCETDSSWEREPDPKLHVLIKTVSPTFYGLGRYLSAHPDKVGTSSRQLEDASMQGLQRQLRRFDVRWQLEPSTAGDCATSFDVAANTAGQMAFTEKPVFHRPAPCEVTTAWRRWRLPVGTTAY